MAFWSSNSDVCRQHKLYFYIYIQIKIQWRSALFLWGLIKTKPQYQPDTTHSLKHSQRGRSLLNGYEAIKELPVTAHLERVKQMQHRCVMWLQSGGLQTSCGLNQTQSVSHSSAWSHQNTQTRLTYLQSPCDLHFPGISTAPPDKQGSAGNGT